MCVSLAFFSCFVFSSVHFCFVLFLYVYLFACLLACLFLKRERRNGVGWVGSWNLGGDEGGKTDQICCRKNLISIKGAYLTHRLKSIIEGSEDRSLKQKLWRNLLACSCLTSISLQHRTTCPGNNAAHNGFIKPCWINSQSEQSPMDMATGQSHQINPLNWDFLLSDSRLGPVDRGEANLRCSLFHTQTHHF